MKEQHYMETSNGASIGDLYSTTPQDNEMSMSWEDRYFLEIMEKGMHKNDAGNWEMPLPFRSPKVKIPKNRKQALHRLHSLRRAFSRKPQMERHYVEFMGKIQQLIIVGGEMVWPSESCTHSADEHPTT